MAIPAGLNDLAKVALLASDASYFTSGYSVLSGSALVALPDTTYGVAPQYSVPSGYFEVYKESTQTPVLASSPIRINKPMK